MENSDQVATSIQDDIYEILTEFDRFLDSVFESPLSSPTSDTSDHIILPSTPNNFISERDQTCRDDEAERLQNFENAHKFFKAIGNCDVIGVVSNPNPKSVPICPKYVNNYDNEVSCSHNDRNFQTNISQRKSGLSDPRVNGGIALHQVSANKERKLESTSKLQEGGSEEPLPVKTNIKNISLQVFPLREPPCTSPNCGVPFFKKCSNAVKQDHYSSPQVNFVKFSECLKLPVKTKLDYSKSLATQRAERGVSSHANIGNKLSDKPEKRNISSPVSAMQPEKLKKEHITLPTINEIPLVDKIKMAESDSPTLKTSTTMLQNTIKKKDISLPVILSTLKEKDSDVTTLKCCSTILFDELTKEDISSPAITKLQLLSKLEKKEVISPEPKFSRVIRNDKLIKEDISQPIVLESPLGKKNIVSPLPSSSRTILLDKGKRELKSSPIPKSPRTVLHDKLKKEDIFLPVILETPILNTLEMREIFVPDPRPSENTQNNKVSASFCNKLKKNTISLRDLSLLDSNSHQSVGSTGISWPLYKSHGSELLEKGDLSSEFKNDDLSSHLIISSGTTVPITLWGKDGCKPNSSLLTSGNQLHHGNVSSSLSSFDALDINKLGKKDITPPDVPHSHKYSKKYISSPVLNSQLTIFEQVIGEFSQSQLNCQDRSASGTNGIPKTISPDNSKPESIFQSRSESVPRSRPESVPRSRPESVPRSRPESGLRSRPESGPRSRPESVPRSRPESVPRSRPESVPRSRPESVPRSRPESVPRSRPESVPRSKPESVPRSKPESVPRSKPKSVPRSKPESVPRSRSECVPRSRPESVPRSRPESVPRFRPESVPPSRPDIAPRARPESIPPLKPERIPPLKPERVPPLKPERVPPSRSESIPRSRPESVPCLRPECVPPFRPESVPRLRSECVPPYRPESVPPSRPESGPPSRPESVPPSRPESVPPSRPAGIPCSKPKNILCSKPENVSLSEPESVPRSKPEIIPCSGCESIAHLRPESVPRSEPEGSPLSRPESVSPSSHSVPRSTSESVHCIKLESDLPSRHNSFPRSRPESVSCSRRDSVSRFRTKSVPQSSPESVPRASVESIPHSTLERVPRTKSESGPRSRPEIVSSFRHEVSQSGPESVNRSSPEIVPCARPGIVPRSRPEIVLHNRPEIVTCSRPDILSYSKSGSFPQSEPESVLPFKPESSPSPRPKSAFIFRPESVPRSRPVALPRSRSESVSCCSRPERMNDEKLINISSDISNPKYITNESEIPAMASSHPVALTNHSIPRPNSNQQTLPLNKFEVPNNLHPPQLQVISSAGLENCKYFQHDSLQKRSRPTHSSVIPLAETLSHNQEDASENEECISYVRDLLSTHSAKIAAGIMSVEHRGTKALELWSRRVTQGYEGVNVCNMTTAWRDGLAFCALIHHFRPDLIDFSSLKSEKILENNALAFRVAEQHLGIPALLDAEDMIETAVPDRLSILTYVSQFYQAFNAQGLIGPGGRLSPLAANNAKNINPAKIPFNHKTPSASPILTKTVSKAQPISQPPATLQTKTEKEFKTDKVTVGVRGRREICTACNKTVFLAERLAVGFPGQLRHRTCFRCDRCSAQLTLASYYETEKGQFCCETCPDEERAISSGEEGDGGIVENKSTKEVKRDESSTSDSESDSDDSVCSDDELSAQSSKHGNKVASTERSVFLQETLGVYESSTTSLQSLPLNPQPPKYEELDSHSLPESILLPLPSSPPPPKPARSSLTFFQDVKDEISVPLPIDAQPPSVQDTDECHSGLSRCDYTKSKETTPPSNVLDTGQSNQTNIELENVVTNRLKIFEQDLSKKDNVDSNFLQRQSASNVHKYSKNKELQDIPRNGPQVASIKVIFETNSKVSLVSKEPSVSSVDKVESVQKLDSDDLEELQIESNEPVEDVLLAGSKVNKPTLLVNTDSESRDNFHTVATDVVNVDRMQIISSSNVPINITAPSRIDLNIVPQPATENNPFERSSDDETTELDNIPKSQNGSSVVETVITSHTDQTIEITSESYKLAEDKSSVEKSEHSIPQDEINISSDLSKSKMMENSQYQNKLIDDFVPETSPFELGNETPKVYPVELNPFDDEEEPLKNEQTSAVEKVDSLRANLESSNLDLTSKKVIKAPINPFDSEEEEDAIASPEIEISKIKSRSNPFWSDEESDSSASSPSKRKVKPPRPPPPTLRRDVLPPTRNRKLILPNSGFDTPPSPSLSNRSSSSDQSTFRLKKKQRHAPAPPSLYISPFTRSNESGALLNQHDISGEACGSDDAFSRKMQKDLQNRTNKMMGSTYNRDNQSTSSAINGIVTPKSERGEWRRKKGPAPLRPVPQKRAIRKLPMRQIQQELYDIEVKQTELERQGVLLETVIREKTEGSTTGSSGDDSLSLSTVNSEGDKSFSSLASNNSNGSEGVEVEDMILQLFELVNEKNELFRRQTELMYLKREKRLEEEYAELEYQIRCLMLKPQSEKSEIEISQEEELIGRLVKVVEQRDQVVNCLEMERQREAIENESIASHMIKYQEKHIEGIDSDGKESSKKKKKKKLRLLKKKKKGKNKEREEKIDADKDVDETELKKEKRKKNNWFRRPNL